MLTDQPILGATIFEYGTSGFNGNNRELWAEVAQDMAAEYPETYRFDEYRPMSLTILDSAQSCPSDSALIRFRVLRANGLRISQHTVLLELSLGNCFSVSGSNCQPTADISTGRPDVAKWVRAAAMIPHREHVERARQFVIDADDAGWSFPNVDMDSVSTGLVMLANGQGSHEYRPRLVRTLAKDPCMRCKGVMWLLSARTEGCLPGLSGNW